MGLDGVIAVPQPLLRVRPLPGLSFGFVGWVVLRHRDLYPRFRNWFLSVTLLALVIHVAYPLAPPRMLDHQGFVDTLQRYGPSIYTEDTNQSVANQFAAMPSLHFGWALLIALMFVRIKGGRWSWLALAHPADHVAGDRRHRQPLPRRRRRGAGAGGRRRHGARRWPSAG